MNDNCNLCINDSVNNSISSDMACVDTFDVDIDNDTNDALESLYNKVGPDVFAYIIDWYSDFHLYYQFQWCMFQLSHRGGIRLKSNVINILDIYGNQIFTKYRQQRDSPIDKICDEVEQILGPYNIHIMSACIFYRYDSTLQSIVALRYAMDRRGMVYRQFYILTDVHFGHINGVYCLNKEIKKTDLRNYLTLSTYVGQMEQLRRHLFEETEIRDRWTKVIKFAQFLPL